MMMGSRFGFQMTETAAAEMMFCPEGPGNSWKVLLLLV
jgi:hypothetical protein